VKGQFVDVSGKTIGKGYAGGMKRWNFRGLEDTHGVSVSHRSIGSTGQCQDPGRVFKGKKMAGHMGDKNICVQNLKICTVDAENNVIAICGYIPGKKNTVVYITSAVKKNSIKDNNVNGLSCEG
jgi:large subunit ribosomal protein L3